PGGSWQVAKAYSSANTFTWNTLGLAPGNYLYTAWARDASSSGTQCGSLGCPTCFFPTQTFNLTLQSRTSASHPPSPGSPQLTGTSITFTATSTSCTNPRHHARPLPPGGSWQIAKAYSTGNTLTWNTSGLAPGNYLYTAWVRDASSNAPYDAYFVAQT